MADEVIQGNALDLFCPVESLSLLYLNPQYDFEIGEGQNRRIAQVFLELTYRWLNPGGVLVLVIPGRATCRMRPDPRITVSGREGLPPDGDRVPALQAGCRYRCPPFPTRTQSPA